MNWEKYLEFACAFQADCTANANSHLVHIKPVYDPGGKLMKTYYYNSLYNILLIREGDGRFKSMFRPRIGHAGNDLRHLTPHASGQRYFRNRCI